MKRAALFSGYWTDAAGERIGRATKLELREANRLWWKHADLRGRRSPSAGVEVPHLRLDNIVADELDQLALTSLGEA